MSAMASDMMRPFRQRARSGVRAALHALSRSRPGTRLLNEGVEAFGDRFQCHFFLLASELPVPQQECAWRVSREDTTLRWPVAPRWPMSWRVALSAHVHERGIQRFCRRYRELGDASRVIVDVGANHGLFSLPFAARDYRCVLFEPQADCLAYVAAALALNGISPARCELVPAVLADRAGTLTFFSSHSTFYSSLDKSMTDQWEASRAQSVPAYTLDEYAGEHGLVPSLIKIDVEGSELRVLQGAREVLARHRPAVIVEAHASSGHRQAIYELLRGLDYDVSAIPDDEPLAPLSFEQYMAEGGSNFGFVYEPALKAMLRS